MVPLVGISIAERMRDRGLDCVICYDDLSKHSKAYRQIALINYSIPSRSCYPADIFNIHSSLLERASKLRLSYFGGSVTAFPIIETINQDISEYIATNIISITDGQLYTSRKLFVDYSRPAIDSALSVSRIGSNAQCKLMKQCSNGVKNDLTNYRLNPQDTQSQLDSLNALFYQDYSLVSSIDFTIALLLLHQNDVRLTKPMINCFSYLMADLYFPITYMCFLIRSLSGQYSIQLVKWAVNDINQYCSNV
jgi:hypothetical protein